MVISQKEPEQQVHGSIFLQTSINLSLYYWILYVIKRHCNLNLFWFVLCIVDGQGLCLLVLIHKEPSSHFCHCYLPANILMTNFTKGALLWEQELSSFSLASTPHLGQWRDSCLRMRIIRDGLRGLQEKTLKFLPSVSVLGVQQDLHLWPEGWVD